MNGSWKASYEHRVDYGRRMNEALNETLEQLSSLAMLRDRGSWFGSLTGLLNHIIVTDIHWLDRFRPLSPEAPPLCDGRLEAFSLAWKPLSDDFTVLREGRGVIDALFCEWFAWFPEEDYGRKFEYVDSGGGIHGTIAATAFDFVLMHQNYHRGQISQILDEIGLPHSFADNGEFIGSSTA